MMTGVYQLASTRDLSKTRYVGLTTTSPEKRLAAHLSAAKRGSCQWPIYRWIRKELAAEYDIVVVKWQTTATRDDACALERSIISELRASCPAGQLLNILDGGQGASGFKMSEEARRKIGDAHRGMTMPADARAVISQKLTGRKQPQELVAKRAKTLRTTWAERGYPLEGRAKISRALSGKKRTPEQIAAMRERLTGRTLSDEHRLSISDGVKKVGHDRLAASCYMMRRCLDCGKVYNVPHMGKHLKKTGHSGFEDVL